MRTSKKYDVRLNEILDAAELLFVEKGYEKATINDILGKVGIGKGTFYYYFKSKEEVMDGVIRRMINFAVSAATEIAKSPSLLAHEKFKQIIRAVNLSENPSGKVIHELHSPSNAQMHQKSISQSILAIAPILGGVVKQGIREGIYHVEYPEETMEFLLAANQFIFDHGIMKWKPEELTTRYMAFICMTQRALGAFEGSFDFLLESFQNMEKEGAAIEHEAV